MRASEWVLACMMTSWGIVLAQPADTFSLLPIYAGLHRIAEEEVWSLVCLFIGMVRLIALAINGAMPEFTLAARTVTAFLSCFFWFQITLGVIAAGVAGTTNTAIAVYPWLAVLDVICVYRIAKDHARYKETGGQPDLIVKSELLPPEKPEGMSDAKSR
jgi:hypothetical protein